MPEQPETEGDDEAKEQHQESPSRRPADGACREKQGQSDDHKHAADFDPEES